MVIQLQYMCTLEILMQEKMNGCDNDADVIAVYRYDKTSNEDLQFEKGERLTILRKLTVSFH